MEDAEKSSLGAFERFLYWMFIPFVFTVVCVTVLLSLFDYDVKNELLRFGHSLPLVGKVVPAPAGDKTTTSTSSTTTEEDKAQEQEKLINDLKEQAALLQSQLQQTDTTSKQKDQTIKDLQTKVTELEQQQQAKAKSDEEYAAQVQQLATTYAKMSPSKAAPLIENLTLKEQMLVLGAMKQDERVGILEKMDPKKAAEASIGLKDVVPAKDQEIAALQERLKVYEDSVQQSGQKLTSTDIGQTFSNMVPKSAATILLEMQNANAAKVLDILSATDAAARAKIMAAIADIDKATAASISAKLAP